MSKRNKDLNLLDVSQIKITILEDDINSKENISNNLYKKFCDDYLQKDFEKIKSRELKKIYEDGIELLNTYYITNAKRKINEFIFQIQFITIKINSVIENRQNRELIKRNEELSVKLYKTIETAEKLEKNIEEEREKLKHVKNDMKSITTTIISIILAISIIPTTVAGIEKISPDYILPFLSSVVLFGIIMISFVYTIYQDKLKKTTWIMIVTAIILCIFFWCISFKITIKKENTDYINEQQTNNTY
ncbi:MAG: hypothetical protein HFJ17_01595 [Clostridia bacterium]|nr:hypothetical protein [Clostridia bacterium]